MFLVNSFVCLCWKRPTVAELAGWTEQQPSKVRHCQTNTSVTNNSYFSSNFTCQANSLASLVPGGYNRGSPWPPMVCQVCPMVHFPPSENFHLPRHPTETGTIKLGRSHVVISDKTHTGQVKPRCQQPNTHPQDPFLGCIEQAWHVPLLLVYGRRRV